MSNTRPLFLDVPLDRHAKQANLPHIYRMQVSLSISEAARRSGINRRTLQRWIREGLVKADERGHITLESLESVATRPKKAGRPAGQNLPSEAEWMRLVKLEKRPEMLAKIVNQMLIKHHEELVKCLPIEQRQQALKALHWNPITEDPMTPGQAQAYIESQFLKPERWRKKWQQMRPFLAKQYPGAEIVTWDNRLEYVHDDSGQPLREFYLVEEPISSKDLMTWGDLAEIVGAPVYIVPAMHRRDNHRAVVNVRMVRDGDRISRHPKLKHRGHQPRIQGGGGS